MFKTLRLACTVYTLIMMIPLILAVVVGLMVGSLLGVLPDGVNQPVVGAERGVAVFFLNGDLGSVNVSVRDVSVTPVVVAKSPKTNVVVALDCGTAAPKDAKTLAVESFKLVGNHLGMPLGISPLPVNNVTLTMYLTDVKTPFLTATTTEANLANYLDGTIDAAAFTKGVTFK
jgi:hypothetical protein